MGRIVINEKLRLELQQFRSSVELCDHSGQVFGHFVPRASAAVQLLQSDECPYSPEELHWMRAASDGRSLTEILGDLNRQVSAAEQ